MQTNNHMKKLAIKFASYILFAAVTAGVSGAELHQLA